MRPSATSVCGLKLLVYEAFDADVALPAVLSRRQHTAAYGSIRQHTAAHVSIRQRCDADVALPAVVAGSKTA
jgi:hypothetical protein